jgi:hypothetical protein
LSKNRFTRTIPHYVSDSGMVNSYYVWDKVKEAFLDNCLKNKWFLIKRKLETCLTYGICKMWHLPIKKRLGADTASVWWKFLKLNSHMVV